MAAVGDSEMSPITNVYAKPFTKILCLLPTSLGVSVEDFRRSRLPPDHWIDTRKFLTRRRKLPSGIFELFGNFSDVNGPVNVLFKTGTVQYLAVDRETPNSEHQLS